MNAQSDPGLLQLAGVAGVFVLLVGAALLVAGIVLAVRRAPRRLAYALAVFSLLPVPIGLMGNAIGEIGALNSIVRLGPAVTPKDLAAGGRHAVALRWCVGAGWALALIGAATAVARADDGPT